MNKAAQQLGRLGGLARSEAKAEGRAMIRTLWVLIGLALELVFSADARREWRHDMEGEGEQ